jgi:hypothetical protein
MCGLSEEEIDVLYVEFDYYQIQVINTFPVLMLLASHLEPRYQRHSRYLVQQQ